MTGAGLLGISEVAGLEMGNTEVDLQLELTEIDRNRVNTINTADIDHLALRERNNINSDLLISHMEGNMLLLNKDLSTVEGHLNLTDLKVLEVSILVYLSKASFNSDRSQQQYRPQSPGDQYNIPQQGQFSNRPPNKNQYRQRSVDLPDQAVNLTTDWTLGQILSPDLTANQDLNFKGLVVPATNHQSGQVRVASVTFWKYHYQVREI